MTVKLTERRKADRAKLAKIVMDLCAEKGAKATLTEHDREVRVEIELGEARVGIGFEGDTPAAILDNYCMPWNTALYSKARFSPAFGHAVMAEVNPHHRAKCMGFAPGIDNLVARLGAAMDCINSGRAFLESQPHA